MLGETRVLTYTGLMYGKAVTMRAIQVTMRRWNKVIIMAFITRISFERLKRLSELVKCKKETDEDLAFSTTICLV
jgi:hypothetical protein